MKTLQQTDLTNEDFYSDGLISQSNVCFDDDSVKLNVHVYVIQ